MKDYKLLGRNNDLGLLILRLSVGGLMLLHGIFKLTNGIGMIEQMVIDTGMPTFIAYGVYVGEVVAPVFIISGLATRVFAAILAFDCAVAAFMVHSADIFTLNPQGGWSLELLGLYFFGALVLVFTGGGRYAISSKYIWD